MFTVVICSESFLNDMKRNYSHILDALLKEEACAVCVWHPDEPEFEDALPDLKKIISGKVHWRAIVIQDGITFDWQTIDKQNPFDHVGSIKVIQDFKERLILDKLDEYITCEIYGKKVDSSDWEALDQTIKDSAQSILAHRENKKANYKKAVLDPLTRLGIWLCGIEVKNPPEKIESFNQNENDDRSSLTPDIYEDTTLLDRNYFSALLAANVLPSEIEQYHILSYKREALFSNFCDGSMVDNIPETILVFSERVKSHVNDSFNLHIGEHEELEYSNFCDDNLYPGKMRFIFFDVNYENRRRNAKDYLAFLATSLVFTRNGVPESRLRAERVYKSDAVIDDAGIAELYNYYLSKLKKTQKLLMYMLSSYKEEEVLPISSEEAAKLFESDVKIPVEISSENSKDELMGKHDIGLAGDCPRDEYHYWYNQIQEISKKFIRYLREPRRAVKRATSFDFRVQSSVQSDEISRLNEFQLEDIQYRLDEEEQNMIETTTTALFDTCEYTKKIDEADRNVRKGIAQRMTKKKTVITAGIAILAYMFGFLPLLFGALNTLKSFFASFIVASVCVAIFALIGFIFLFILRKRLINRIKHFNYVMSGILSDIDNGLNAFSRYLSHACNVRRTFSVLNAFKKKDNYKVNILKKHILDVESKIKSTEEMFVCEYNGSFVENPDVLPFPYDFSVLCDYSYEIQYDNMDSDVEFIIKGNMVSAPVDYVESITLTREELYD